MSQVIRIPFALYSRLEKHAIGFDTPANVIERLLDFYESQDNAAARPAQPSPGAAQAAAGLNIVFYPADEQRFKQLLLQYKKAWVLLHKADGSTEIKEWHALKFTEDSNLRGNLLSGYLRGWRARGIYKAEIALNKKDLFAER